MSDIVTDEERLAADGFYMALGRAIARWSGVENALLMCFASITKINGPIARSIFFSARSFQGRHDALAAAITHVTGPPGAAQALRVLLSKSRDYSVTRNAIAHDSVAFIALARTSIHYRQLAIVPSEKSTAMHDSEIFGLSELHNIITNFSLLLALLSISYSAASNDEQLRCPERLILLASLLPKSAHERPPSPTEIAEFERGLRGAPYPV